MTGRQQSSVLGRGNSGPGCGLASRREARVWGTEAEPRGLVWKLWRPCGPGEVGM